MDKVKKTIAFLLLGYGSLYALYIAVLTFIDDIDDWLPPSADTRTLMCIRFGLFVFFEIGSVLAIVFSIHHRTVLQQVRRWGIFIILVVVVISFLTAQMKTDVYQSSCCGDGARAYWGYPYPWISCWTSKLCDTAKASWVYQDAFLLNPVFWFNVTICVIGVEQSLPKLIKRIWVKQQTTFMRSE